MAGERRPPRLFTVPPGTPTRPCKSRTCGTTLYFIPSQRTPGGMVPIDCRTEIIGLDLETGAEEHCQPPSSEGPGRGVIHFTVCDKARNFKKPKPPAPTPIKLQRELTVPTGIPHCIVCGCSAENRCAIPRADLSAVDLAAAMYNLGAGTPEELPETLPCNWLQHDPPICSAKACREARKGMPLRMKLRRTS